MEETIQVPFQRVGAVSNAHVGRDFEISAMACFAQQGIVLQPNHEVLLGVGEVKKAHQFDLGCDAQKILVECKSHRWTAGSNIPSAKLTVWNEAMYYFHLAPADYRKIMFVLHDHCPRRQLSLATYYLQTYRHLIPHTVEFWEYDPSESKVTQHTRR
jgi:hypothetical protein